MNAASHSCTVVCGTFLSPVKGAQDPFEKSVRTHWTFSGTLEKSNFKGKVFAFVADFFCFWPPEPSLYRQEIWKSMLEGRLDEWKGVFPIPSRKLTFSVNSPSYQHQSSHLVSLFYVWFLFPKSKEPPSSTGIGFLKLNENNTAQYRDNLGLLWKTTIKRNIYVIFCTYSIW